MTNLDVTYANLWWSRVVYQEEAILVFGDQFYELSESRRQQHFQGFNPDYEKFGSSLGSRGFQYLIYLDRTFNQLETGLDLSEYPLDDRYDVGAVEHYRQFGFSH